jgi:antitoxin component YwqK of YwqJK toxin-antitoxin module
MYKQISLAVFFLFLVSTSWSFAPRFEQDDKLNQTDPQGRKQGRWVYYGKDRPESGIPATGKVEEGKYVDDRKEGIWIKYHDDGTTPKLKGTYVNNRPMGAFSTYWPNGKLKEKGVFEKGMYHDTLARFYENGQTKYIAYHNATGKESGKVTYFYANGQKEYEYFSKDGTITGKAVKYYENGDVKEITYYDESGKPTKTEFKDPVNPMVKVKDPNTAPVKKAPVINGTPKTQGVKWQPNGYNKVYNDDNEIWQDGYFKNGTLWDGKVYEYDRDGILLKVSVYKQGVYHSDGQL